MSSSIICPVTQLPLHIFWLYLVQSYISIPLQKCEAAHVASHFLRGRRRERVKRQMNESLLHFNWQLMWCSGVRDPGSCETTSLMQMQQKCMQLNVTAWTIDIKDKWLGFINSTFLLSCLIHLFHGAVSFPVANHAQNTRVCVFRGEREYKMQDIEDIFNFPYVLQP